MCGRYKETRRDNVFLSELGLAVPENFTPRHNIAPTQQAWVVAADGGSLAMRQMRWGLVPFWAKDKSIGAKMINARSEEITSKPAFRIPFKKRRCLVLADGFYEWPQDRTGVKGRVGKKSAVCIQLNDGQPFVFAGIWDVWESVDEEIASFSIITTGPNALIAQIHTRMPVIFDGAGARQWLCGGGEELLKACPAERMNFHRVGTLVNSAAIDSPECWAEVAEQEAKPVLAQQEFW